MSSTLIGAVFTGIAGVLVAWTQLRAQGSGASRAEARESRRERKRLEEQMLGIRRWAIKCEERIRELGQMPPRRPPQFDLDWGREPEQDDEPTKLKAVRG